jgi:DNA-binding SARP family transcriptional activator
MASRTLSLELLGGFRCRLASGRPVRIARRKARALLTYLALNAPDAPSREHLAALLWPEAAGEQARQNLRQTLLVLRRSLGRSAAAVLVVAPETVAVRREALRTDVARFERLVADGTVAALQAASALWHGELVADLDVSEPFAAWLRAERERLRALAIEELMKLLLAETRMSRFDAAAGTARRLLAIEPTNEAAHRALMRAFARQGRLGAASRQYRLCATTLQRELGVEPDVDTRTLHEQLLHDRRLIDAGGDRPRQGRRSYRLRAPSVTPLIGRAPELQRLRDARRAAWTSRGHVFTLVGEAGIGKTRLVEEAVRDALSTRGDVLVGHAYETEQALPLAPWVDAFRGAGTVADTVARAALPLSCTLELARLFPEIGEPEPFAAQSPEGQLRLFQAVHGLVMGLAAKRPLLVVLEDLQWSDEPTLRLIAYIGRRISTEPVLLVLTVRGDEIDATTPRLHAVLRELERAGALTRLPLSPLSRAETASLVQSLCSHGTPAGHADQLAAPVWDASGGNPFVVVETVRALHEAGLSKVPDGFVAGRVAEMTQGRFDRLSRTARHLLDVAAAVARPFDLELLVHAAARPARETTDGVEELLRRGLLVGAPDRLTFGHERIRSVAYDALSASRRVEVHGAVAAAIEALYGGRLHAHHAALAVHCREGRLWAAAARHFGLAGLQAVARSARREAVHLFEQALAALGRAPESRETLAQAVDLRLGLRSALFALGKFREIGQHMTEAEELARRLEDPRRLAWALAHRANVTFMAGRTAEATALASRARTMALDLGDRDLAGAASYYAGQCHSQRGEYREAAEAFRLALEAASDVHEVPVAGWITVPSVVVRAYLCFVLGFTGAFARGIESGETAVAMARARQHHVGLVLALCGLSHVHVVKGELAHAEPLLVEALELTRDPDSVGWAAHVKRDLGHCLALSGRVVEGVALLDEAIHAVRAMGIYSAPFLVRHAEALLHAGDVERAGVSAAAALGVTREHGQRSYEAWSLKVMADTAVGAGPAPAVETQYRAALALAEELGMRPLAAHCHLGLGELYRRSRQWGRAREHVRRAADCYGALDMRFWLDRVEPVA